MIKFRTTGKFFAILLSLAPVPFVGAAETPAYVDGSKPFIEIKDIKRQAETWAVCAASYDIMATIMEARDPARSRQLGDLANGAKVAVGMTLVINDLDPEISPEKFEALWTESNVAMAAWPQAQLTSILAEAEAAGAEGAEEFGKKINATVVTCINNLKGQRWYVDTWKELVDSGLLKLPEN